MEKVKLIQKDNGILEIQINRPEIRNAIDEEVMDKLKYVLHQVKATNETKALVITGAGDRAFCSGGDLSVFHELKSQQDAYQMLSKMRDILYEWMMLPIPTFALLNGSAVGGGCELATACDFRIARENIKIGFIQGKLAITTGWGGASMLFEKLPYDKALSMLMSAKVYTSEEAYQLGFVTKLIHEQQDFKTEAYHYIEEKTTCSKDVLKAYKSLKIAEWEKGLKKRMEEEILQCSILWEKEEHLQAVDQFLNR
ncbi:enoyl-CoA hydratase/isomerase family protein [Bacillus sp. FJAT-47783]|uniref:enoyl-CoA hydratase/isomerase family protein n=1 Tax=Bacillus sp. FJAT-47783 TaxID=2922712 RepID=UPI001FACC181|nr:enoyl-CoA hydratase/isomerase family protein [Bacillus sp. FJAT-47783]